MRRLIPIIILLGILAALLVMEARTRKALNENAPQAAVIESAEFKSEKIGDSFKIDIVLPDGYDGHSDTRYPVLYMTDGNGRGPDYEVIQSLEKAGDIRDLIIVGIGYPANHDVGESRVREFNEKPDDFLQFILKDVVPYVDQNYKTDTSDRTLYGSSLGGYFSLYAFMKCGAGQGDVFRNYVAVSWCCMTPGQNAALFEAEERLNALNPDFSANLYVTVGSWEQQALLNDYNNMINTLKSRHYAHLTLTCMVNEGMDHSINGGPTLVGSLKAYYPAR